MSGICINDRNARWYWEPGVNPAAVSHLTRAWQAAWKMEQTWRYYKGLEELGPEIWHFFQDRLAFALG